MNQNYLNALQKQLSVLVLTLILTATLPGLVLAMDLGAQLGGLQTKLVGLKGKLGQLKGGLENLKDVLDGKPPKVSGSGGITISSGLGVLDWVQVADVDTLKKSIMVPIGLKAEQEAAVKRQANMITTALNYLYDILNSANSEDAVKGIKDNITKLEKEKNDAPENLKKFLALEAIHNKLMELKGKLTQKKPIKKIDFMEKETLKSIKEKILNLQEQLLTDQYTELETALNDISKASKIKLATELIGKLSENLVTNNPRGEKEFLVNLTQKTLSELKEAELNKHKAAAKVLFDDSSHSTLDPYKQTFKSIITMADKLIEELSPDSGAGGGGKQNIESRIANALAHTEIKSADAREFASIFAMSLAELTVEERKRIIEEQLIRFLNLNIVKGHKDFITEENRKKLANIITRLNLDLLIHLDTLDPLPNEAEKKANFNTALNQKSNTNNEWYAFFQTTINKYIIQVNTSIDTFNKITKQAGLQTIKTKVKELRDEKPVQVYKEPIASGGAASGGGSVSGKLSSTAISQLNIIKGLKLRAEAAKIKANRAKALAPDSKLVDEAIKEAEIVIAAANEASAATTSEDVEMQFKRAKDAIDLAEEKANEAEKAALPAPIVIGGGGPPPPAPAPPPLKKK